MNSEMPDWFARSHHDELLRKAEEYRRQSRNRRAALDARRQQNKLSTGRHDDTSAIGVLRTVAFVTAVISVLPYLAMKTLWLTGSHLGMRPGSGVGEMHDQRFVIGNVITVCLALLAVMFATALSLPRRRLVPGWLVVLLGGGSAGTLAPIALGLPMGVAVQFAILGTTSTGGEGNLRGAVFAVVYSGFGILGVSLALLLGLYVVQRWPRLVGTVPQRPADRRLTIGCGIGMLSFAVAMLYWGLTGPGRSGPAGFVAIEQRTVLVVIAVLTAAGFGISFLQGWSARHPRSAWLIGWVGCATAALQGPTLLLLSQHGVVRLPLIILTVLATPCALIYGVAILHRSRHADRERADLESAVDHDDPPVSAVPSY